MSDSGRLIGECEHGYQRWHCETCKLRAVADRLEHRVAEAVRLANGRWDEWGSRAVDVADAINNALNEYRKAVSGGP